MRPCRVWSSPTRRRRRSARRKPPSAGPLSLKDVAKTATYTRAYAESNGFMTLLSDGERLTGAYALGPEAGEWLQQATLAIRARVPLAVLRDTIQPFPTFSEIYLAAINALWVEVRGCSTSTRISRGSACRAVRASRRCIGRTSPRSRSRTSIRTAGSRCRWRVDDLRAKARLEAPGRLLLRAEPAAEGGARGARRGGRPAPGACPRRRAARRGAPAHSSRPARPRGRRQLARRRRLRSRQPARADPVRRRRGASAVGLALSRRRGGPRARAPDRRRATSGSISTASFPSPSRSSTSRRATGSPRRTRDRRS